jgi:UDP-N-acetylglucosamine 2-epimerase
MPIVMNYEAMFGSESELITDKLMPEILPVTIRESVIKSVCEKAKKEKKWVLIFVVGTKPCFYKFWGSIVAAEKYDIPYFIVNAGQHYESILTYGIKEFNYEDKIAVNLSIRGDLAQKAGEIIFKMSWLARYITKHWPKVMAVPVVLGDTILTNTVPMAWMFSVQKKCIHNEAGLRSMYPLVVKEINKGLSIEKFIERQFYGEWKLLTIEPFPEQYDTYTASAGCEYLFAPLEINKKHLLREGYNEENIFVIGGTVVDALELKMKEKPKKSIFSIYPQLGKNKWIRIDIHRKENLTKRRLQNIVGAITELVKKKYHINFVEMNATKIALEQWGLLKDLLKLRKYKNFLYTPIWQEYSNVIEFYRSKNCLLGLTDSGGLQEELNMIGKPCLTLRFNTDRPETIFEGKGNLLVPPISKEFIVKIVEYVCKNEKIYKQMSEPKKLYGEKVGEKFIQVILTLMKRKHKLFTWAQERLDFWKEK